MKRCPHCFNQYDDFEVTRTDAFEYIIKTDEEIQQEQQQMQMAQMMQAGVPNATKGMMDAMNGGTE